MNEWPKLDPITNRKLCARCWEGIHWHKEVPRKGPDGRTRLYWVPCGEFDKGAMDACDGECSCVHREMKSADTLKKFQSRQNRQERRKREKEMLESSPLAVRTYQDAG